MDEKDFSIVVFKLDDQRYGIKLSAVERVIRIVAITPLPHAPEIILGLVNIGGRVIPVADIRQRFHLPPWQLKLNDQLILAHTSSRAIGLIVDEVDSIHHCPSSDMVNASAILPAIRYVDAVLRLPDGLVLIHDLDRFLSLEEEQELAQALNACCTELAAPHRQADSMTINFPEQTS